MVLPWKIIVDLAITSKNFDVSTVVSKQCKLNKLMLKKFF